jgi:hypothetical protein
MPYRIEFLSHVCLITGTPDNSDSDGMAPVNSSHAPNADSGGCSGVLRERMIAQLAELYHQMVMNVAITRSPGIKSEPTWLRDTRRLPGSLRHRRSLIRGLAKETEIPSCVRTLTDRRLIAVHWRDGTIASPHYMEAQSNHGRAVIRVAADISSEWSLDH